MALQVYINFNGNCREAVEFYKEVFKTEQPKYMLFGDVPESPDFPLTESAKSLVMHTELIINDCTVMFSDVPPGMPFVAGNNISLTVVTDDMEEIKRIFNELKVDGTILMDLQETFWSKCYGNLVDKYGIGWQLSHNDGEIKY